MFILDYGRNEGMYWYDDDFSRNDCIVILLQFENNK